MAIYTTGSGKMSVDYSVQDTDVEVEFLKGFFK